MNPVVIQVNPEGRRLINNVCDAALKQAGLSAFNDVSYILANIKLLPSITPPQKLPGTEPIEPKKETNIIPLKQPEKK